MASQKQLDCHGIEIKLTTMKNSDIIHLNHKAMRQNPTSAKAVMPMRIIKVVFARILMQSFPCLSEACSVLHCGSGFFLFQLNDIHLHQHTKQVYQFSKNPFTKLVNSHTRTQDDIEHKIDNF